LSHRIAAAIALHRPERDLLLSLVSAIAADVERIFLFLNSALPAGLIEECAAAAGSTPVETLGSGVNMGCARVYNDTAAAAVERGCDLLLQFDQDSNPSPGMPRRLMEAFDQAGGHAGRVAVIGPRPVPLETDAAYEAPMAGRGIEGLPKRLREVPFLISSGSLIDLQALAAIGPFRDDFFTDGNEIEWCFRARARGFRCVMALCEPMPHRLGVGLIRIPLLGIRLAKQPPVRLFTYARNQIAMMRLPHVPLWWKARAAALIALRLLLGLRGGFRGPEASAILRGIRSGLRGELGRPIAVPGSRAE
jgi:rhamnosyltransferase